MEEQIWDQFGIARELEHRHRSLLTAGQVLAVPGLAVEVFTEHAQRDVDSSGGKTPPWGSAGHDRPGFGHMMT